MNKVATGSLTLEIATWRHDFPRSVTFFFQSVTFFFCTRDLESIPPELELGKSKAVCTKKNPKKVPLGVSGAPVKETPHILVTGKSQFWGRSEGKIPFYSHDAGDHNFS